MTVSTTDSVVEYVSGGPFFPVPYRFLKPEDIEVVLVGPDGEPEKLVLGAQYSIVGAGLAGGGAVTSAYASAALVSGMVTLTISRVMTAVQPTDLRNQGRFLAETHETVFDRLTMLVQQGFSILRRALLRPLGKNYYDAQGRQLRNLGDGTAATDAVNVRTLRTTIEQALAGVVGGYGWFLQIGAGAIRRTFQEKMRDKISAKDYGAIFDGQYHSIVEWWTPGYTSYRGYVDFNDAKARHPFLRSPTDSIDWAALQAALDENPGCRIEMPPGVGFLTDTLYLDPGRSLVGAGRGDNYGVTSTQRGTELRLYGPGYPRIWTDVGLPDTPAGTLVDAPTRVAICVAGTGCSLTDFTLTGGSAVDGSDTWEWGIFNASVRRTLIERVETMGTFHISGCCIDATWSNTNAALQNLHKFTYGRTVISDQASNEVMINNCWLHGGNWGLYTKGTDRTDLSANIWSPGGVSDLSCISCRIDNEPLGTRPNYPENSGGYYRDLHNNFQNRRFVNCRIGSQTAYGVFLDRGRFEHFEGFYGETRADRCLTSLVTKTVDALGVVQTNITAGSEWSGTNETAPVKTLLYLTDTTRVDVLAEKIRINSKWTHPGGSFTVSGVGYDSTAGRAFLRVTGLVGIPTAGQTLTQAAGQNAASGGHYGTDRCLTVCSSGRSSVNAVVGENLTLLGTTVVSRNFRGLGLRSDASYLIGQAGSEVSINCNDSQVNFWINRYGFGGLTTSRLRWLGTSLDPYTPVSLGSSSRHWSVLYADSGSINTSDARLKTDVRSLSQNEVNAAKELGREIGFYQFLDSIEGKKNDPTKNAREHCGMTVQRVIEIMESHGLDPFNYSFVCYDKWEAEHENGVCTTEAGDLYSFRVEGLLMFIARGFEERLIQLETWVETQRQSADEGGSPQ